MFVFGPCLFSDSHYESWINYFYGLQVCGHSCDLIFEWHVFYRTRSFDKKTGTQIFQQLWKAAGTCRHMSRFGPIVIKWEANATFMEIKGLLLLSITSCVINHYTITRVSKQSQWLATAGLFTPLPAIPPAIRHVQSVAVELGGILCDL